MSTADTPSFDNFFQEQKAGRQQSGDSFEGSQTFPGAYDHSNVQLGQVVTEEPLSLLRRDSVGSSSNAPCQPHSASNRLGSLRQDSRRKDSFPWQSTMITTAGQQPRENIGNIMFQGSTANPHSQHYSHPSWDGSQAAAAVAAAAAQYDTGNQYGQHPNAYLAHSSRPAAANEYLPHQSGNDGWAYGQENGAGGVSYDWSGEAPVPMEGILGEDLQELERIISTSQAGSVHPSREGTPFQTDLAAAQQSQQDIKPDISDFQSLEATATAAVSGGGGSRSPSPYQPLASVMSPAPSGTFPRNSPSPHGSSPFANKPQSPPALIIPSSTSHSSPATQNLPPIITATDNQGPGASRPQQGAGIGGTSGGLFPPANPALTGMAGISPIAPNADGPMIYIQPSTPISGLKDSRGVFDFKRVAQGQHGQAQPQHQQVEGFVPPPTAHSLSRHASVEGLNQAGQSPQPQHQNHVNQPGNQTWDASWGDLRPNTAFRPRAKSDSQAVGGAGGYGKQVYEDIHGAALPFILPADMTEEEMRAAVDQWRANTAAGEGQAPLPTLDPRQLPGQDSLDSMAQFTISQQFCQLRAQRYRLPPLNVAGVKQEPGGQMSPTSLAFYAQLGVNPGSASQLGTVSAPFYQSTFAQVPEGEWPHTAGPTLSYLAPEQSGHGPRRRSFAAGSHPAAGAGTPGYGVEFASASQFGTLQPGRLRSVSPGHRRTAKSEDYGRSGSGWGMGAGGSTADFLSSITANDGSLVPPARGRSHSRHSSVSSGRSASPALSISSQGSSYSHYSPRMDMPDGVHVPQQETANRKKVTKMKVTSIATEVASNSRRTNDGVFKCPVPGCGSTFTRHFNLKGHLRSHNDERPYKCLYEGCPKATVGFARQHDCKRHMLLHEGLRPFECEGCGKKFARLDALTRHHKSEQGQECAISHPLPTNPDGSAMSESQYKAYRARQHNAAQRGANTAAGGAGNVNGDPGYQGYLSGGDLSGGEEDFESPSGLEEY